jgi:hypothetical protein
MAMVLVVSSCSNYEVALPRLEWEGRKKDPSVPLRVRLELDSSVQQAAFSYKDACGKEAVFQFGPKLSQMLLEDSKQVFQQVVDRQDPTFDQFADAVLQYTILESHYEIPIPRMESWAEYPANAMLRIRAVLREAQTGKEMYAETFEGHGRFRVSTDWDGNECTPIGIGIPVNRALDNISNELLSTMRDSGRIEVASVQLVAKRQQVLAGGVPQPTYPIPPLSAPVVGGGANPTPPSTPSAPVQDHVTPSVQFRTKLVDANRNLVLEGGEALKLLLEIQNVSDSTIPSAYVELRGTPVLIEAFKRVVSIPVPLGSLKAGEKRTAEIRGRLPRIKKKRSGELIVGIILSEGLPPGIHSIRAEIIPGPASQKRKR